MDVGRGAGSCNSNRNCPCCAPFCSKAGYCQNHDSASEIGTFRGFSFFLADKRLFLCKLHPRLQTSKVEFDVIVNDLTTSSNAASIPPIVMPTESSYGKDGYLTLWISK